MRFRGRTLRLDLNEISGSLGDLATFLPLAVGLIAINGLNATSIFLSAGLLYIAAGVYYGVPVPVQPLKATSAIAIAMAATPGDIAATALLMGLIFVGISFFNLSELLRRAFPRPIVRGIQLGLGVLLAKKGLAFAFGPNHAMAGGGVNQSALFAAVLGGIVLGIILLSRGSRRYPAALVVIVLGLLCGVFLGPGVTLSSLSLGWIRPEWGFPLQADLHMVILVLLLPQIPLTFANSVVATADTASCYYGEGARRVTVRGLAASLGIANLFSALIGGMPMCHGSGGVTAHYRFGARTGGANLFIGGLFVVLALLFGKSIASLFGLLPPPVLGILLVYVGLEHARLVRDIVAFPRELTIAIVIGLLTLVTGNLAVAFAAGIALNATGRWLLWKDPSREAAWEESP
ncbi:MAG: putative sulfate/molybdate transporter [Candidatus Deferrimicrobiaceae bacterium]